MEMVRNYQSLSRESYDSDGSDNVQE